MCFIYKLILSEYLAESNKKNGCCDFNDKAFANDTILSENVEYLTVYTTILSSGVYNVNSISKDEFRKSLPL